MSVYKSGEINLPASAEAVYSKLSNLEGLKDLLANIPGDAIPEDKRKMMDDIVISGDSISFPAGPMGSMTLKMTEKVEPSLIKLTGENSPVPLSLAMHITPEDQSKSKGFVEIDIQIPALLRPMIGGQIQKMTDQFGEMLKNIPFA